MKNIKGFERIYFVSRDGNVFSKQNGKLLKLNPSKLKVGYLYVTLYKQTKRFRKTIHRLVAEAYLKNKNNFPQVNHKDGNKTNNNVSNLEWCTASQNKLHSWRIGSTKITEKFRQSVANNGRKSALKKRKFNKDDIKIIKELRKNYNITHQELCNMYKVSIATIYKIVNNLSYNN